MNRSLNRHGLLGAAVSFVVAPLLYSATLTNRPALSPPVAKPELVETDQQVRATTPSSLAGTKIVYKPPLRGAPAVRIDGGSRGSGVSLTCLTVLAPDHTGLTVQDQPALYWYQSAPAGVPFELTVIEDGKPQPLLRIRRPDAKKFGIQHIKLSDFGVKLSTGIEYEWVVALVVDPESRSKDVIASGFIKRVEPTAELRARLANADKEDLATIYAGEGFWYDAVDALFTLVDERPHDRLLQAESVALLDQAGLNKAAAYAGRALQGD
ncbi:MAG TPA: DUF928 domain-containing protein [Verrucomicrobiae bacterium]|nr:DUF928 domain-containing protein [Verrucomicrobiae bacterium]